MADYPDVGCYRHYSHFVGGATMSQCSNCSALAGVIKKQQAEIQKLKQAITEAQAVCVQITRESSQIMAQHGSPYRYDIARGAKEAIQKVESKLKV